MNCQPQPPADPNMLWGGPYPISVGSVPPTQQKIWYDTVANQMKVWNYQTVAWQPVNNTVVVGTAPTALGSVWLDAQQKLWVKVDDMRELTFPFLSAPPTAPPVAVNGAPITFNIDPPENPPLGALWYDPIAQNLWIFNWQWIQLGSRVMRSVRIGNYAGCWNAGGNRAQAEAAGGFLFVAGIRGINPTTQQQVPGPGPQNAQGTVPPNTAPNANGRIDQTYQNIKTIVEAEGLTLYDCMNLDTYLASAAYIGPTATEEANPLFWGAGPYPNRTHITEPQMSGSDAESEFGATCPGYPARGDVVEVTSIFFLGNAQAAAAPNADADAVLAMPGVQVSRMSTPTPRNPGHLFQRVPQRVIEGLAPAMANASAEAPPPHTEAHQARRRR